MMWCIPPGDDRGRGFAQQYIRRGAPTWLDVCQPKGKLVMRRPTRIDKKTGELELLDAKRNRPAAARAIPVVSLELRMLKAGTANASEQIFYRSKGLCPAWPQAREPMLTTATA